MNSPAIEFHASYTYPGEERPALRDLSFTVSEGEWVAIIGPGGSGKTTICSLLCGTLQAWPGGSLEGELLVCGRDYSGRSVLRAAGEVGAVFQDPESALIHDIVEDELAFGPENLCIDPAAIEERIDAALSVVGMPEARRARTSELSGGQQQRVSIASVLTMRPRILVMDEASANLDSPSAEMLEDTLKSLHGQGHTIITASSRWDVGDGVSRVIIIEEGRIIAEGSPPGILSSRKMELVGLGVVPDLDPNSSAGNRETRLVEPVSPGGNERIIAEINRLHYAYPSSRHTGAMRQVLHNVSTQLCEGDLLAVLGPNGSGKTTFGKLLAGLLPAPAGSVFIRGRDLAQYTLSELSATVGYVFQRPQHQFVADTVLEECTFGLQEKDKRQGEYWLGRFGLRDCKQLNPHQLGIAEQRLLNLASATILEPELLILDEPTAGLDYRITNRMMQLISDYAAQGNAVMMITHDVQAVRKWATKQLILQ